MHRVSHSRQAALLAAGAVLLGFPGAPTLNAQPAGRSPAVSLLPPLPQGHTHPGESLARLRRAAPAEASNGAARSVSLGQTVQNQGVAMGTPVPRATH